MLVDASLGLIKSSVRLHILCCSHVVFACKRFSQCTRSSPS